MGRAGTEKRKDEREERERERERIGRKGKGIGEEQGREGGKERRGRGRNGENEVIRRERRRGDVFRLSFSYESITVMDGLALSLASRWFAEKRLSVPCRHAVCF